MAETKAVVGVVMGSTSDWLGDEQGGTAPLYIPHFSPEENNNG